MLEILVGRVVEDDQFRRQIGPEVGEIHHDPEFMLEIERVTRTGPGVGIPEGDARLLAALREHDAALHGEVVIGPEGDLGSAINGVADGENRLERDILPGRFFPEEDEVHLDAVIEVLARAGATGEEQKQEERGGPGHGAEYTGARPFGVPLSSG